MTDPFSCPAPQQGGVLHRQPALARSSLYGSQTRKPEAAWHFDPLHEQWVITAHALVKAMLLDPRLQARPLDLHAGSWLSRPQAPYAPQALVREQLLFFEANEQGEAARQLRGAIHEVFKHAPFQQQLFAQTDELLAALADQDQCDIVQHIALPLTAQLSASLLGLEWKDQAELEEWVTWSNAFGDYTSGHHDGATLAGILQFSQICACAIAARRARQDAPHDLLSFLLATPLFACTQQRLVANMQMLFAASRITTEKALSTGIQQLVEAHAWQQMREDMQTDPTLLPVFVEELLRVGTPTRTIARWAMEDLHYGDLHMSRGQKVVLSLEAANADPAVFCCPREVIWSRRSNPHVSFGAGAHACPGAGLARLALQRIFASLFQAAIALEPTTFAPSYRDNPNLGGLSSYIVTIRLLGVTK